jgi:hypothetical protein
MIGNLEADDAKLLQTAIVGQPELQRIFASQELRQLRQRIFRTFHLPELRRSATEGYIRHRLSVVTDNEVDIFDADAIDAIHEVSRGLPRIINTVCDNALLSAYSADRRRIDRPFIKSVVAQMMFVGNRRGNEGEEKAEGGLERASQQMVRTPQAPTPSRKERPDRPVDVEPALHSVGNLPSRAAAIETCLRELTTGKPDTAHATCREMAVGRGQTITGIRDELTAVKHDIRSKISHVTQRLHALEGQATDLSNDRAEAQAIRADLQPLVQQASSIVGRAEAASKDLGHRDDQLRKLAGTVKNVVFDLRRLLDRAHEVAGRNAHAERTARSVHSRLVAQTERSRKLAKELTRIVDSMVSRDPKGRLSTPALDKDSAPADPLQSTVTETSSSQNNRNRIQRLLRTTQESLSDLRTLASGSHSDGNGSEQNGQARRADHEEPPVARLAQRVENLLEMIDPPASATVS